ncbi:MAG: mechanosensitive ion channel family protein [Rhodoferax sp.]|nr:mechanosensitive ion channel family protein [Rhodoferax sp.]
MNWKHERTAIDLAIQFGPKLLVALLILAVGFFARSGIAGLTDGVIGRLGLDQTLRQLRSRVVRILEVCLFAIMAMQNLGIELLSLLAGLGLAGAGVALAMQGILGNLAAGLTIIFTRSFLVGEHISIAKEEGVVEEIRLFDMVLSHTDRSTARASLSPSARSSVKSCTTSAWRARSTSRWVLPMTPRSSAPCNWRGLLTKSAKVLTEPAPVISVLWLSDSAAQIGIRPWTGVADYADVSSQVTQAVLATFRANGIGIPLRSQEVRLLAPTHRTGSEGKGAGRARIASSQSVNPLATAMHSISKRSAGDRQPVMVVRAG